MADFDALTYHRLIGRYNGIVADTTGPVEPGNAPDLYAVNMAATIRLGLSTDGKRPDETPELRLTTATPPRTLLLIPVKAAVESGVLRLPGATPGVDGVQLVAKSSVLGLDPGQELIATVTFAATIIAGTSYTFDPVSYVVPTVDPADYHAGETQIITLTGVPDGGTWSPVYANFPTVGLTHTATAGAVADALNTLDVIPDGAVSAVGNDGGPWTVTFDTDLIPRPLPLGAIDNLTGTGLPGVSITDPYTPPTIDLTTVARWEAVAA